MSKRVGIVIVGFFALIFLAGGDRAFAQRSDQGLGKWLQEVGISFFHSSSTLKQKGHIESFDLGLRFGFDLKPFVKKFGLDLPGMLELSYEPFMGSVIESGVNFEMGLPILFRYSYPLTQKFYLYAEAGSGPYYYTLQAYEQSTQFNFISQGGAGVTYFLREDLGISVGYRRRHVSNAGIENPNGGIDGDEIVLGASLYF